MFWGDVKGSALSQALLSSLRLVFMPNTQQKTWHSVGAQGVFVDGINDECSPPLPVMTSLSLLSTLMNPTVPWNPSLGHILIYGKIFPHFVLSMGSQ